MSKLEHFFMDHKASPDWAVRRRIIILSMIWEAALLTAIVVWWMAFGISPSLDLAFTTLSSLFGGTLGSYVFGAIWDDRDKRRCGQQDASQ